MCLPTSPSFRLSLHPRFDNQRHPKEKDRAMVSLLLSPLLVLLLHCYNKAYLKTDRRRGRILSRRKRSTKKSNMKRR